jgi:hypothetical protein
MRKIKTSNHVVDLVFLLALFCVFAATVLSVLMAGANVYQEIASKMEAQYTERTCLTYLDAKIRHYDEAGMVTVERFGEGNALALYEDYQGVRYKTLIYYADGYLRELYFEDGLEFQPEDGQAILAIDGLQIYQKTENLLQLVCTNDAGRQEQVLVYLRSGKGAACNG